METRFLSFANQHQLWQPGECVGVAVSGGIDSMVLLRLFMSAGISIRVLHVNFQLRGAESDGDEAFLENFCHRFGLALRVKRVETKLYASERGLSLQEAARALRYEWFKELQAGEISKIATAHHMNDSAETFFLNLVRGTGISGLSGIPVNQRGIVRPLLFATREDIENYAAEHHIVWREDTSNQTDDYRRNQIRHRVVPQFRALNPSWLEGLTSTQARLRAAESFLAKGIVEWKSSWQRTERGDWLISQASIATFAEPAATLWEAVKEFQFSLGVCEQLVQALAESVAGKRFESATHQLWIDRGTLILAEKKSFKDHTMIIRELGTYAGPGGTIVARTAEKSFTVDRNIALLDSDRLKFPVVWRRWQAGDQFRPLGMSGFKKLSDFLIDQKVPMAEKSEVTVLEAEGQIIWVVGFRIDDRFKVTEKTKHPIALAWSR